MIIGTLLISKTEHKSYLSLLLFFLIYFLYNQNLFVFIWGKGIHLLGWYCLNNFLSEGVGIVENLQTVKELEKVEILDPNSWFLSFEEFNHVGNGREVVDIGEELTFLLVFNDRNRNTVHTFAIFLFLLDRNVIVRRLT